MKLNMKVIHKPRKPIDHDNHFQFYQTSKPNTPQLTVRTMTDAEGLSRAYKHGDYYVNGKTMYVAGSHTAKDWYDDVTKIPFWGDLRDSTRYQNADQGFKENPQVDTLVGHSLGGSVVLEMQKNYNNKNINTRTYGAPVFDPLGHEDPSVQRYRNWLDPVSIFDRGAEKSLKLNPFGSASMTHDYNNIGNRFERTEIVQKDDHSDD